MADRPETVKFAVFRDKRGNRFVFPSLREDAAGKSIDWSECMMLRLALNIEQEADRLIVPVEGGDMLFEHICSEVTHNNLKHGAATVYLIGGPEFEAAKAGVQ